MQLFCGKQRGSICVFLTLILVPVLMFSGIIVDASRLFASKTVVSGAGDLTMNAALAQYDKKLKDKYGLTAMAKSPDSPDEQQKLEQMFKESVNAKNLKSENSDGLSSLIQLEETDFEAKGVTSSSLAENDVFRQQVMEYMKFRGPVYMADDLLAKITSLSSGNMKKKQKYVETKSAYALKASELSLPIQNAKFFVEKQANIIQNLRETGTDFLEEYQEKTVFWLAARSLQKYIDGVIYAEFPEDAPDPVTQTELKEYLAYPIELNSDSVFDDQIYINMVTLLELYQQGRVNPTVRTGISQENGYTEEEIQSFNSIRSRINNNITRMNNIYSRATEVYDAKVDLLSEKANEIISNGEDALSALKEVEKAWKKVYEEKKKYDKAQKDLRESGEVLQDTETENVKIDKNKLKELKTVIKDNMKEAKEFKKQLKKFENLRKNFEKLSVNDTEAYYIREMGGFAAIDEFWSEHSNEIYGDNTNMQIDASMFYDPCETEFYKSVLKGIKEETVQEEDTRQQNREEAKTAGNDYKQLIDSLKNLQKEQDLSDRDGYPSKYPSGIMKVLANATGEKVSEADISSDKSTVQSCKENMNFLNDILSCLDTLAGGIMEQAYLMEYTTEMFNCITTRDGATSLSNDKLSNHTIWNGEMEYILFGNASTGSNKTFAVSMIYGTRLAIDSVYIFLDKDANKEAEAVAVAISTATGQAWLHPIIKYSYLFCKALAMAARETVALVKGEESAVLPGKADGFKFTYKDYMKLFILIALTGENGKKDLSARAEDCIQLNTGSTLSQKYTMLTLNAKVQTSTTFLPKVPEFLGKGKSTDDGKRTIDYKSVMAY